MSACVLFIERDGGARFRHGRVNFEQTHVCDCEVSSGVSVVARGERVGEQLNGALELAFAYGDCAEACERDGDYVQVLLARAFEVAGELEGLGGAEVAREFVFGGPWSRVGSSCLERSRR
jgi:hypothetical protein